MTESATAGNGASRAETSAPDSAERSGAAGVSGRADALERAVTLVEERGVRAQLCVVHEGVPVLDRSFGVEPDSLFWIFSTSKPFVALLIHLLAERGALSLDDPVAAHWPAFAAHGKGAITVRQVLQHRSGVPVTRGVAGDMLSMAHWGRAVRDAERARPRATANQGPAYHVISYGVILGELVRRVAGAHVPEVLSAAFLEPLGMRDTYLGLPRAEWGRHVPVRGIGVAAAISGRYINRPSFREAVIPAAGVSTTARDVARFYQALLSGGELDGARILKPESIDEARKSSTVDGERDSIIGLPIRWAQGFQLGGPSGDPAAFRPMGRLSSPLTFGHNGSNCCLAWADPGRRLVFVYLTDLLQAGHAGARHQSEVSDAVIRAFS